MQCWDPPEITRGREDDYHGLLDKTPRNEAVMRWWGQGRHNKCYMASDLKYTQILALRLILVTITDIQTPWAPVLNGKRMPANQGYGVVK